MFRIADEWIEPRWIKEGSQRNNDICAHHTSPSYFAIIEKRRRWPGNAFVPMDETSRKVRFTGIEARDNSTVFFNPPLFDPRGRGTYEVRIKLCERDSLLKIFTRWNMLERNPVYPMCHGNAVNGSCHRQALDRTCGCGINGD